MEQQTRAITRANEAAEAAVEVATLATKSLMILSHALEPALYDQAAFVDKVKRLILYHGDRVEPTTCRIIVANVTLIAQRRHRLLALSRKLNSRLLVRQANPQHAERQDGFVIADHRHLLHLNRATDYRGEIGLNVPHTARRLAQVFNEIWSQSAESMELRRLSI